MIFARTVTILCSIYRPPILKGQLKRIYERFGSVSKVQWHNKYIILNILLDEMFNTYTFNNLRKQIHKTE